MFLILHHSFGVQEQIGVLSGYDTLYDVMVSVSYSPHWTQTLFLLVGCFQGR